MEQKENKMSFRFELEIFKGESVEDRDLAVRAATAALNVLSGRAAVVTELAPLRGFELGCSEAPAQPHDELLSRLAVSPTEARATGMHPAMGMGYGVSSTPVSGDPYAAMATAFAEQHAARHAAANQAAAEAAVASLDKAIQRTALDAEEMPSAVAESIANEARLMAETMAAVAELEAKGPLPTEEEVFASLESERTANEKKDRGDSLFESLERGIADADAGRVYPASEVFDSLEVDAAQAALLSEAKAEVKTRRKRRTRAEIEADEAAAAAAAAVTGNGIHPQHETLTQQPPPAVTEDVDLMAALGVSMDEPPEEDELAAMLGSAEPANPYEALDDAALYAELAARLKKYGVQWGHQVMNANGATGSIRNLTRDQQISALVADDASPFTPN